ncbi:MAG TPA: HAD-IB family hydrolase [Acidimicrobiia bacterium]|nr:HAD-IB family hydrolase [Acidimicrobiia bacterium]
MNSQLLVKERQVNEPKKVAAFFDLDNTLIRGATLLIAAPVLRANGFISRATLVRAGVGAKVFEHLGATEARVDKVKKIALEIVDGWNREEMFKFVEGTLDDLFRPLIHAEGLKLVKEHIDLHHEVAVVSSSPIELVRPIASMFGIHHAIATEVRLDADGNYTNEFAQWVSGKAKPDAVRAFARHRGINLSESFGYSDSRTDIGFLQTVGNPICVNPDRELSRHARENGWDIRSFADPRKPVNAPERRLAGNPWIQAGAGVAGVASVAAISAAGVAISRHLGDHSLAVQTRS